MFLQVAIMATAECRSVKVTTITLDILQGEAEIQIGTVALISHIMDLQGRMTGTMDHHAMSLHMVEHGIQTLMIRVLHTTGTLIMTTVEDTVTVMITVRNHPVEVTMNRSIVHPADLVIAGRTGAGKNGK